MSLYSKKQTRPKNRKCPVCGRMAVAPEQYFGKWVFPPQKKCKNCTSLEFEVFEQIRANRKLKIRSQEQAESSLPLRVLDMTNKRLLGLYHDFPSLTKNLSKYRKENPKSRIKVIDTKFHNMTPYFPDLPKSHSKWRK